jgi:hypothetical protein
MAIVAVQQPKIREPKEKEDPFDRILKGLQIASNIYGIKTSFEQSELNELRKQRAEQDIEMGERQILEEDNAAKKRRLTEQAIILPSEKREMKLYDVPSLENFSDFIGIQRKADESGEEALKREAPSLFSNIHRVKVIDPETEVVSVDRVIPVEKIEDYFKLKDIAEQKRLDRYQKLYQDKAEENQDLLVPGYGIALTKTDAKELKDAVLSKLEVDRILSEMEDLRKKHGFEVLDRAAVERGQQLSKMLLVQYKNLAKLGVLSESDEKLINAIIPEDPLGMKAPWGEDPILSSIDKLKTDFRKKLEDNMSLRLKTGFDFRSGDSPASILPKDQTKSEIPGVSIQQQIPSDPTGQRKRLQELLNQ